MFWTNCFKFERSPSPAPSPQLSAIKTSHGSHHVQRQNPNIQVVQYHASNSKPCRLKAHGASNMMLFRGYLRRKKISTTLQGEVYFAVHISLLIRAYIRTLKSNESSANTNRIYNICCMFYCGRVCKTSTDHAAELAVKTADKSLHVRGMCLTNGREKPIKENIVREAHLMALFQEQNPPESLIRYYDFYEDDKMYHLVMEKGGIGLLDFTKFCHERIVKGTLSIKKWREIVRFIFSKMAQVTDWMHHTVNCCHLDISLENVVMSDDTYFDEEGDIRNLGIRFIDFGLAEMFEADVDYICTKYVGKTGYKAPSVYNKVPYDAKKADIWSLGICLFMLSIGSPLYRRPSAKDDGFNALKQGQVKLVLQQWDRYRYVSHAQYDLMMKMLVINERQRLSIKEVMNHDWIRSNFQPSSTPISLSSTSQYGGDAYCVVNCD